MPVKDLQHSMPLGKLCSMVTKPYFGALLARTEHLGIEKNFSVLILIEKKADCTQQFISDSLQIDKVSMVKIIDGFSKQGLVQRRQNPDDRREYFIELTGKGRKLMPKIHKTIDEINKEAFRGINEREKKKFYEILIKVAENVKDFPSSHIIVYKASKRKKV